METIVVTGAAGFIGSAVVREWLARGDVKVVGVDKLTYAGRLDSLREVMDSDRFAFVEADVADREALTAVCREHGPRGFLHLAAESHVDRSIDSPTACVNTNVVGTFALLETAREHWARLSGAERERFRFLHVSTDEVHGDLGPDGPPFDERAPYDPGSPYSATKAAADHLVRAWHRTYGLPVVITNGSNNYGPRQFPEKLIPHTIVNALEGRPLPVYGDGRQVRDWLHVEDHARALAEIFLRGRDGETYHVGARDERRNLDVVRAVCASLDEQAPERRPEGVRRFDDLITFVEDRPGHDRRYAVDPSKLHGELGWEPRETFRSGLEKTVRWYRENEAWWRAILAEGYRLERLGPPDRGESRPAK